jgi:hypothetical protein
MAEWLKACRIDTVALQATGVYSIPLYDILSGHGIQVVLVNAQHTKNVPGRKFRSRRRAEPELYSHLPPRGLGADRGSSRETRVSAKARFY